MDITKCEGKGCPIKGDCERFLAPDNLLYQSYFAETPRKDGKCDFVIPAKLKVTIIKTNEKSKRDIRKGV